MNSNSLKVLMNVPYSGKPEFVEVVYSSSPDGKHRLGLIFTEINQIPVLFRAMNVPKKGVIAKLKNFALEMYNDGLSWVDLANKNYAKFSVENMLKIHAIYLLFAKIVKFGIKQGELQYVKKVVFDNLAIDPDNFRRMVIGTDLFWD